MVKKSAVPDAWDDDWETLADKAEATTAQTPEPEPAKVSKAERLAKHAESNKKLWDSAESPEPFHFLAARDNIPLKTEFKPALKVLSRKPAPKTIEKHDPLTGQLYRVTLEDEDDEDKGDAKKPTPEELRAKAQADLEERQRKYEEKKAEIWARPTPNAGAGEGSRSGESSPGKLMGEGRGGRAKGRGVSREKGENARPGSSNSAAQKELFDPNFTPKPSSIHQRGTSSGRSTPREKEESQIIRQPLAPDSGGRGGFARFSPKRGNKGI